MFDFRFNPFENVEHNQWRKPRWFFHLAHVAWGFPAALLGWHAQLTLAWIVVLGALLAYLDKCLWFNWKGRAVQWDGFDVTDRHDWADFTSDLGLTVMGAVLPALVVARGFAAAGMAVAVYYVLSLFNGT